MSYTSVFYTFLFPHILKLTVKFLQHILIMIKISKKEIGHYFIYLFINQNKMSFPDQT